MNDYKHLTFDSNGLSEQILKFDPKMVMFFTDNDVYNPTIYSYLKDKNFRVRKTNTNSYVACDISGEAIDIPNSSRHFTTSELACLSHASYDESNSGITSMTQINDEIERLDKQLSMYAPIELDFANMSDDEINKTINDIKMFVDTRKADRLELNNRLSSLITLRELMQRLNIVGVEFGDDK